MFTKFNFDIAALLPSDPDALIPSAAGLYISPERTVETDGHQIVMVTKAESQPTLFQSPEGLEEAEFFTPFLMDRDSAAKLSKVIPKRDNDAPENAMVLVDVHTESDTDATFGVTEDVRRAIMKSLKGDATKFPDIDKVIPALDQSKIEISFNADILVPVLAALRKFSFSGSITIGIHGAENAMRIDAEGFDGQVMTAFVMPMRSSEAK